MIYIYNLEDDINEYCSKPTNEFTADEIIRINKLARSFEQFARMVEDNYNE